MFSKRKFRAALAEAGITQQQLAEKIGMSNGSMTNKVNGFTKFSIDEAYAIISVTQMRDPVGVFFAKDDN